MYACVTSDANTTSTNPMEGMATKDLKVEVGIEVEEGVVVNASSLQQTTFQLDTLLLEHPPPN